MATMQIDDAKLEALMGQMVGFMTGATTCFGMWLGDELGLYRTMAEKGPMNADALASATNTQPRLVREWLDGQTAVGLVRYDLASDRYQLEPEAAMVLADDNSPVFMARAMNALGSIFKDMDKLRDAYTHGGAMSWSEHDECLFRGTEWLFRTGYRAHLPEEWIPALDGVEAKLQAGARAACSISSASSTASTTWATPWVQPNTRVNTSDPTAPCCSSSRSRSPIVPPTSPTTRWPGSSTSLRRQSARRTRSPKKWGSDSAHKRVKNGSIKCSPTRATPRSARWPRPQST